MKAVFGLAIIVDGTLVFNARDPVVLEEKAVAAAELLRQGKLVAFPTETVYGLGASVRDERAVSRIFEVKGRPVDNPLIVHLSDISELPGLARNIPAEAWTLARRFWPGPLTLVLEKQPWVPGVVTGGLDSVAVRVPDHPVALALLRAAELPVAAPSANISGRPSPTTAEHVLADLAGRISAVLDGGPCDIGVESTVLDIRGGRLRILRPGSITPQEIAGLLQRKCEIAELSADKNPPSPGLKYRHYAPRAPLYLFLGEPGKVTVKMQEELETWLSRGKKAGLLVTLESAKAFSGYRNVELIVPGSRDDPAAIAARLYAALREFDARRVDVILAEGCSPKGAGLALLNRLQKTAGENIVQVE